MNNFTIHADIAGRTYGNEIKHLLQSMNYKITKMMPLPLIYSIYRPLHPSWASCSHRLSPLSDLAQNSKHFLSNCKCDSKMSKCQI